MKTALLLIILNVISESFARPDGKIESEPSKCKLVTLIPGGSLHIPGVEFGEDPTIPIVADPLPLENVTVRLDEEILSGTYSFGNGIITGLSTLEHDFDYNPLQKRIRLNGTLSKATLTGVYDVIDGKAKLKLLGDHTFSGAGPLNASISGAKAIVGFMLKMDLSSHYISVKDLKVDFDFESAYVVAENLVLDGEKVDWNEFNEILKPTFDLLWEDAIKVYIPIIENEINSLLEGCTLMDIIGIVQPQPKP